MRIWNYRIAITALVVTAVGCGGPTGVEPPAGGVSGPPPKRPNDDMMQPKGKQSKSKSRAPRAPGGPPPIPRS